MNRLVKFILIICIIYPLTTFALKSDNKAPASIYANSATINRNKGMNTFIGNVIITQGTTKLFADKLVTYTNKQNKIIKAMAYGKPAQYQTLPKKDQQIFHAYANSIEYYPPKHLIILLGDGKIQQGNNSLQGPHIEYNSQTGKLVSKPKKGKRTSIIFQPQGNDQK